MRHHRHVASLDEVRITRDHDGETALIEYADDVIGGTHLKLGPALRTMTDAEVLERFNDMIAAMEELRQDYKHLAIEVPIGQPQIEWSELTDQWCARGDVLRCVIHDGGGDDGCEPLIESARAIHRLITRYLAARGDDDPLDLLATEQAQTVAGLPARDGASMPTSKARRSAFLDGYSLHADHRSPTRGSRSIRADASFFRSGVPCTTAGPSSRSPRSTSFVASQR